MTASATDKFRKGVAQWSGNIGSAGVADAVVTTFPLASASNLPTDTAVMITVNRVDTNGVKTGNYEGTVGVVSGNNLINCIRGVEGTAQAWTGGTVVEILHTASNMNELVDGLLVEHGQDGKHTSDLVTTLKATGAEINTGTEDGKIVTPKAIADSNVVITDKTQTLTNKTLTSPKINEDVALTATATELNNLHSKTVGLGAWTTWSPTTTNITTTSGSFNCSYIQIGKIVHCRFMFTLGASSAMGTLPIIDLPVTNKSGTAIMVPVLIHDAANTYYTGFAINDQGASKLGIYVNKADGSYTEFTNITATVPMTWTTNDKFYFSCTYEAA